MATRSDVTAISTSSCLLNADLGPAAIHCEEPKSIPETLETRSCPNSLQIRFQWIYKHAVEFCGPVRGGEAGCGFRLQTVLMSKPQGTYWMNRMAKPEMKET